MVRTAATIRFAGVALDAADPAALARFYQDLLGLALLAESEDFLALKADGCFLTFWRVDDHRAPDWPGTGVPKQMHIDLAVTDLDDAERRATALGATKAGHQPAPARWRVLLDPAGHPFCVSIAIPEL